MNPQGAVAGYPPSPYIVNLIELQNTINNTSGLTATDVLSEAVADIQKMVDFQKKQVNANFLASYDSNAINVLSNMTFSSNATLTVNGGVVTGTSAGSGTSYISTGNTSIILSATSSPAISLNIQAMSTLTFSQQGTAFFFSTVTCYGNMYASNFFNLSDSNLKHNIQTLDTAYTESVLSHLNGVRFQWNKDNRQDIGMIAQTTRDVLPEAVQETPEGLTIAYTKVIPVLVESVKTLKNRVLSLEKEIADMKSRLPPL
jgi:hypothetical protein